MNVSDCFNTAVDGSHIRASERGPLRDEIPVDQGRAGSEHHLVTDAAGLPLAATLTGDDRNDVTQLMPLLQAVPPVRGTRGRPRPRRRPDAVLGGHGYDHDKYRRRVWGLGVKRLIARRGHRARLRSGAQRCFVERAFAHPHWLCRLRVRWGIRDDIHEAFLSLSCALTRRRRLRSRCELP